ncbi:MAG: hypothetical protein KJ732_01885 [Candidatus Margulisbacteria bacterium]|nr:hypothetical protein [Candidatus Margulisiibacteriota bacterium]
MQSDLKMFNEFVVGGQPSALQIYSWQPKCISYGYAQDIENELAVKEAKQLGWDIVKRPTGGGIVFHNEAEVTYSLVTEIDNPKLPNGLVPAYKKISEAVVFALRSLGVEAGIREQKVERRALNVGLCFSYPAEYEIVVNNLKIVGSAQKRGKRALLQQGSIFVRNMSFDELALLKKPGQEYNSVSVEEVLGREVDFDELSQALIKGFHEVLCIDFGTRD